jgi:tRNA pseudouridine38-40 synthase
MARFKLVVEYAGTRYSGWQVQKNARTVQGEIAAVTRRVSGRSDFELYGSGRTDAGVHALGQVAHLDLETRLAPTALRRALNDELPADVHVLSAQKVPRAFHARHDAVARSYLYQISRRRTAFGKALVWWIKDELDIRGMRAAAAHFVGLHDFRAFTDDDPRRISTRVAVERLDVVEEGALVLVRIRASHFLWKMVRRIVGILAEVGRGAMSASDSAALLVRSSTAPARLTAPPSGLFLERVFYAEDEADAPLRAVINIPVTPSS